jgi:xylulose-5-phosphate/fructose-6-phosphate phosphoketolase
LGVVADKTPSAIKHCTKGIGIWDWASNDQGGEPDVVLASAGDIPTQKARAATALLREHFPDLKVRFVNVVDLFQLQDWPEHHHGLSHLHFDSPFTVDQPIIFNFHGYSWLIHKLTYRAPTTKIFTCAGTRNRKTLILPWKSPLKTRSTALTW